MTQLRSNKYMSQRGFSLTEVLVAVAVFALIFIAALLVYDRANQIFKTSVEATDVQQTTRVAFDRLVADIRMAGFDFDRDGFPIGTKKYQQPDEQLEYIGRSAITIRTNLDYESDAATDNGRETAYEPGFTTTSPDDDFFPVVTTGNEEIVTYALKSDRGSNTDVIEFYADVAKPRKTYPEPGGANETLVRIEGVDLCDDVSGGNPTGCQQPPYTLYRIPLNEDGTAGTPVPIASNLRGVTFSYFQDSQLTLPVTPNGGVGQYIVTGGSTSAAAIAARSLRETVRAIHLNMIGMSTTPDANYRDPIEAGLPAEQQVAAASRFRQYRLESTLIPRNLGKRGVQELVTGPPGAPRITDVCSGGCGVARVAWDAPSTGYVEAYTILYDTALGGAFDSPPTDAGNNLFGYVENLDPTKTYYFKVIAKNAFGSEPSINVGGPLQPINRTKPGPPTGLIASGGGGTSPPAIPDNVDLRWRNPQVSVEFNGVQPTWSCGVPPLPLVDIVSQTEIKAWDIHRSTSSGFTPSAANRIWTGVSGSAGAPVVDAVGNATFTDTTPKQNCVPYYYKMRAAELCRANATLNSQNDIAQAEGDYSTEALGQSQASANPRAPVNVRANAASTCSTPPNCSIILEWNEVTQDTDGRAIQISTYQVNRREFTGGVFNGREVTFDVTDSIIGDGIVTTTNSPPVPPSGTLYHYRVKAKSACAGFESDYSTPDARFPCATFTVDPSASTLVDGSGTEADPWLIGSDTAIITVRSNTDLTAATGTVYEYPGRLNPQPLGSGLTGDPRIALFSFTMTGSNGIFELEMVLTDVNGCAQTLRYWVQEAPAACCLMPYKDVSGTIIDGSILTLDSSTNTVTVRLKNICGDDLEIDELRMRWTVGTPTNDFQRVTYPGGVVDDFGGTPDIDGAAVLDPGTVSASTRIPANSNYDVALKFRRNSTSLSTVTGFCVVYTRDGSTTEFCRVAQTASSVSCP